MVTGKGSIFSSAAAVLVLACGGTPIVAQPALAAPAAPVTAAVAAFPDFDGDGLADQVFGVGTLQGEVVVAYGSGARASFGREQAGGTAVEPENAFGFGQGLLARDLNNDGFTDLVVVDQSQGGAGSALYLVFGAADGLRFGTALRYPVPAGVFAFRGTPALVTEPSPLLVVGAATSLARGGAIAIFELDANGIPNLAPVVLSQVQLPGVDEAGDGFGAVVAASGSTLLVGAPGEDVGKVRDAGAVTVLRHLGDLRFTGSVLTQNSKGVAGKAEAGDRFGAAVAIAGGYAAIGVPAEDSGRSDTGAVATFAAAGARLRPLATITQASKGVPGRSEAGDGFGRSVAIIRSCDGLPAVLVGAPDEAIGNLDQAGAIWSIPLAGSANHCPVRFIEGDGQGAGPTAMARVGAAVTSVRPGPSGSLADTIVVTAPGLAEEGVPGRVLSLGAPFDAAPTVVAGGVLLHEEGTIALSPPVG